MSLDLSALPTPAVIALAVLVVAQVTLLVISVVVLARTARERLVFDRKWPWALIIALVNIIGPVMFLAVGRRAAPVDVSQSAEPKGDSLARAVENLYGENRE
jgi:hypothetical protein